MTWDNLNNEQKREQILGVLVEMSRVDGAIAGRELLFLLDVGQKYGLPPERIREMIHEDTAKVTPPTSELDRMTILYYMLFMMKIDGNVSRNEENLIYHYGFKLGFNESLIREMIIVIKGSIGKALDPNELLTRIKTYLN